MTRKTLIVIVVSALAPFFVCALVMRPRRTSAPSAAVYALAPQTRQARRADEGVYYSLFVRSFADGDGDGIGDFKGLIKKLDYLNDGNDRTTDDLGVTGLWLLPIYPSHSYHGYDVDDYYAVNPDYGSMEDFERLVRECKKRGISVMLDMTFNHSSLYNEWFQASRDPSDPHHAWYHWIDAADGRYNVGQQVWGHDLWNEDDRHPGHYYAGEFHSGMPDFNLDSVELRTEFKKVTAFWLQKGVSGFRYDAALHIYDAVKMPFGFSDSTARAVAWWRELGEWNDGLRSDGYSVGEVWDNAGVRAEYIAGLGSAFHFGMGDSYIIPAIRQAQAGQNAYAVHLQAVYESYARSNPDYRDAPFLTNHDQPRAAGLLQGNVAQLKLAAAMYLLTEGVPFIYYGEEIGMKSGSKDETKRTPLLWNKDKGDGHPIDGLQTTWAAAEDCVYNKNTVSIAEQEKDPDSLLQYYKRLIRLRTSHPALFRGRLRACDVGSSSVASWTMTCGDEVVLVMHNLSAQPISFELPEAYASCEALFISDARGVLAHAHTVIPAWGTVVALVPQGTGE